MPRPRYDVSVGRKTLYYVGGAIAAIGALLFFSTFISAALHFGDFTDFEARGRSMALRAFGGMGMIIFGGVLSNIGRRGAAGSGLVLNPEQAREDLEPWSRMHGGVVNDTLEEIEVVDRIADGLAGHRGEELKAIKIRCRACKALSDENAKFCSQCGAEL